MATDPVCGMQINESEASNMSEYKGKMYHFCSDHCKAQFDKEPEKFVDKKDSSEHHHHNH